MRSNIVTLATTPIVHEPASSPYRYVLREFRDDSRVIKYVVHTEYPCADGNSYYGDGHHFDINVSPQHAFREAYARWVEKVNKQANYVLKNSERCFFFSNNAG
jgi:hypothetical protein